MHLSVSIRRVPQGSQARAGPVNSNQKSEVWGWSIEVSSEEHIRHKGPGRKGDICSQGLFRMSHQRLTFAGDCMLLLECVLAQEASLSFKSQQPLGQTKGMPRQQRHEEA